MWIQLLGEVFNLNHVKSFELVLKNRSIILYYKYGKCSYEHNVPSETRTIRYAEHMDDDYIKSDYKRLLDIVGPVTPYHVAKAAAALKG